MRHDLRERERRGVGIVPALDNLEVRRDRPQIVVCRLVGEVAQTEGLPDFAWREKFFEL
jgi:hypothetical protein